MPFRFALVVLVCAGFFQTDPAEAAPSPAPEEIIRRTIAQDKKLQERRKSYRYALSITRDYLNDAGKVTRSETDTQQVGGTQRVGYEVKTEAKTENVSPVIDFAKIINRFHLTLEDEETCNGVPCYRIRYTPKPDQPYNSREEKVMNAMSGRVWISQADFSIIQNEGKLSRPVSVAWIFATMRELRYTFKTAPLPNGDFGPSFLRYQFKVNAPLVTIHQRHTRRMTGYR
jgi:hypothetical protein